MCAAMRPLYDDLSALCDHVVNFHEIIGEGRHVAMIALPHIFTELIINQFIRDRNVAMIEFVNVTTNERFGVSQNNRSPNWAVIMGGSSVTPW